MKKKSRYIYFYQLIFKERYLINICGDVLIYITRAYRFERNTFLSIRKHANVAEIFSSRRWFMLTTGIYLYPATLLAYQSSFAVHGFMCVLTIDIITWHVCEACGLDTRERERENPTHGDCDPRAGCRLTNFRKDHSRER